MEYSNEFLARCFNAYTGADIRYSIGFGEYAEDLAKLRYAEPGDNDLLTVAYTVFKSYKSVGINVCSASDGSGKRVLLALTPLSAITDEHAIEVAKIYRPMTKVYHTPLVGNHVIVKIIGRQFIDAQFLVIQMIVDYLRSKGYDCGYGDIPSLIEAGLAIDKTTLNN